VSSSNVRSGRDSWVNSSKTAKNYSAGSRLRMKTGANYAFIWLKVPPAVRGKNVTSAKLHLVQDGAFTGSVTLSVQRVASSWIARLLTWTNKPGVAGAVKTMTKTSSADATDWAIDVEDLVQSIANGTADYGFRITTDSSTQLKFYSLQAARRKPWLELAWSERPDAPTNLSPAFGAIGIAKPLVTFDYDDQLGTAPLTALQVQIDAGNNFVSGIDFDSGEVASTVPELDLATTAYAGLSDGATTYMRARAKNSDGEWSDWSTVVSFSRDSKGSLTIDNPAADPNDFVTEFTPPIMWTFTGETQVMFQVRIVDTARPKTILHDSGVIKSTDTSYTLPKRVLKDSRNYTVVVRIWDAKTRVKGGPSDPVYVQASRAFDVEYDATVTAPATLTAVQVTGKPWVDVTVTRATAPDSWTLMRTDDGVETVVDSDIDPSDVFVTGTTYRIRDWTADPERPHTYRVRAEVNGKLSSGGPTAAVTVQVQGTWIGDPEGGLEVVLGGYGSRDAGQVEMGEESGEFVPINGDRTVRIVQSMRGLEGASASNLIIRDRDGFTWDELEGNLMAIKGRMSDTYRLVRGDRNIPVILGHISCDTHPSSRPGAVRKAVDFTFWQQGELPFEADL
jgi:hypothetical protein